VMAWVVGDVQATSASAASSNFLIRKLPVKRRRSTSTTAGKVTVGVYRNHSELRRTVLRAFLRFR
jgi:hypothetical protein